jgi:4-amino-4-deoxy-L-arabinose transferase-like glycosyltransferase
MSTTAGVAHGTRPARSMWSMGDPRLVALAVVFCVGALHALVYVVVVPPWNIEDEPQHVDYVSKLVLERRFPRLDDHLDESVVRSTLSDRDWEAYRVVAPDEPTVESMNLGGYSYAAYHPPLPYLLGTPVLLFSHDRALDSLYGLRLLTAVAAGAVGVLAAHLASRRFRGSQAVRAALAAGLAVGLLPAIAEAGGRFNADIFAALAVLVVVLTLLRWSERPTSVRAWQVGAALAAAVLTRETTVIVVIPLVLAGIVVARRGELRIAAVARVLGPPAVALALWEWHLQISTGRLNGAGAFIDLHGRQFPTLGVGPVAESLLSTGLLPYGHWGLPAVVTVLVTLLVVGGLVLAARGGQRLEALTATAMFLLQFTIMVGSSATGLNTASARLLLPSYPVVIAMATVGWASERPRALVYVPAAATLLLAGWFLTAELWPAYR